MLRIAIKMLFHSRARSLSTLIGVAIAFLLSSAQVGLLVGWCNTIAAIMRHSNVDVWVMAAQNPAFDRDGQYLYFTASTNYGPTSSGLDMTSDEHEVTSTVYLAVLANNVASPLAPESDEEGHAKPPAEFGT